MTSDMLRTLGEDTSDTVAIAAFPACRKPLTSEDAALRSVIERAVVPRLCLAFSPPVERKATAQSSAVLVVHGVSDNHGIAPQPWVGDDALVAEVAELLLADDLDRLVSRIEAVRACGRSLAHIYLGVLMPAAVQLDDLRAADLCGSAAATLAFCNLQTILRRYASDFYAEVEPAQESGLRALLAAPALEIERAGLQVFGLLLASELFRRDGWDTWTERGVSSAAFKETVRTQWFDLVQVLATSDDDLDAIAAGIKLIRRGAPNSGVGIVACGPVFQAHPELVRMVGADLAAGDALASLSQAKHLVARQSLRQRLS